MQISIHNDRVTVAMAGQSSLTTSLGQHLAHTADGTTAQVVGTAVRKSAVYAEGLLRDGVAWPGIQHRMNSNFTTTITGPAGKYLKALGAQNKQTNADFDAILNRDVSDMRTLLVYQRLQNKKSGEIVKAIHNSAADAAVIFANPSDFNLDPAAIPSLKKSVARANLERQFITNAVRTPALSDPLAERPDVELAAMLTKTTLDAIDSSRVEISAGLQWLNTVIDYTSVVTDQPKAAIFDQIAKAT